MTRREFRARLAATVLLPTLLAGVLSAQGVVVNGSSLARFMDLRPLAIDSVPLSTTVAVGDFRQTADGVTCVEAFMYCRFQRSSDPANLLALMQDLDITGWGVGQGVSVHAQLRARNAVGGGRALWPQATQRFDAVAAYLEMERDAGRARVGRQWLASNLGVFNFDGAAVRWRFVPQVVTEIYGGWTLVQGLDRPATNQAIAAVEDLPPTDRGQLIGGAVAARFRQAGLRAEYQREISGDHSGLYAERLALTGEARLARVTVSGSVARDLATGDFNEARARVTGPLVGRFSGGVEARHYVPFFALWTIWGAFAPVGFNEARADVQWNAGDGSLSLNAYGGKRRYEETNTALSWMPLRTDGWRLGAAGAWRAASAIQLQAAYGIDVGFGASRSDADAAVRWEPDGGDRFTLGLRGAALQNIYEFRVGTGRVLGLGGDASFRIGPDVRGVADVMIYRNVGIDNPQQANWNQRRAGVRLEWTLGTTTAPVASSRLP